MRGGGTAGLARLVGHIGDAQFAGAALAGLREAQLRAASWSAYQLWPGREPVLHCSASLGVIDTTRECFDAYRSGLWRQDRSFDAVAPGQSAVTRMHVNEVPNPLHRAAIYQRHHMLERLSVVQRHGDGSLLAVNLYQHDHQGRFSPGEVAGFADLAPVLLAAVQRHITLVGAATVGTVVPAVAAELPAGPAATGAWGAPASAPGLRAALQARCAALTTRELDICERPLRGWTYDGIAADLGLSTATVKTYRARAFARLGLHFKSELFATFMPVH